MKQLLRWVVGPQISDVVEAGYAMRLDAKQAIATGQSFAVTVGGMALETIFAALSATTAVAAGFLFAIGIDIVVLIGKWTIISAIVFYTGILWALISPILALPRTADMAAAHRARLAEAGSTAEKQQQIAIATTALVDAETAYAQARTPWPQRLWQGSEAALAEQQAAKTVEMCRDALGKLAHVSQPAINATTAGLTRLTRGVVFASYIFAVSVLLVFALGPVGGSTILAGLAGIVLLWWLAGSIRVVYPLLSVLLLAFGFLLGRAILGLPPSARIMLDTGEISARVLLTSDQDILVLQGHGGSAKPALTLLPRSAVKRITVAPGQSLVGWPGAHLFQRWLP